MTDRRTIPTTTSTAGPAAGGPDLPVLGFGTYRLRGDDGARAVADALDLGYTLLDSAYKYENEGTVGEGIRRSGVDRDRVTVTSKLPGRYQEHDDALVTVQESLYRTGLDHIDLYLIHWPNPSRGHAVEAFGALLEARERGLVRHVGVCNFLPEHLDALEQTTGELPVVNQIELHPFFPQVEALEYHRSRGIVTQAWSPLGRGAVLDAAPVTAAAEAHGATPGQVVLAWHRAVGSVAIPKASSRERQRENLGSLDVELTADEIAAVTALGRPDGRLKGQDPAVYEEF
ncbi:aldo/keto reductase [Corynebacterium bovis]|uniref:aldo/keto reductase n=1 Tax=Corynebacterium bovis TaxID=36808 RepID=UPI0031386811